MQDVDVLQKETHNGVRSIATRTRGHRFRFRFSLDPVRRDVVPARVHAARAGAAHDRRRVRVHHAEPPSRQQVDATLGDPPPL